MLTVSFFWRCGLDISREAALSYWRDRHAPLMAEIFGARLLHASVMLDPPGFDIKWPDEIDVPGYGLLKIPARSFDGLSEFAFDMHGRGFDRICKKRPDAMPSAQDFAGTYNVISTDVFPSDEPTR